MKQFDPTVGRACAFCKLWYDPTNSAIKPKQGVFWEYDTTQKERWMKTVASKCQQQQPAVNMNARFKVIL